MKGKLTITRNSNDIVRIEFTDAASSIRFAEMRMSLEGFAQAVTGLASVEGELSVRGLGNVGKRLIVEHHSIECPLTGYDKKAAQEWLLANAHHPDGEIDASLSSQTSISPGRDGCLLNYTVRRYVATGEDQ